MQKLSWNIGSLTGLERSAHLGRMSREPSTHAKEAMHEERRIPAWLVVPGILALVLLGILAGRMTRPPEIREGPLDAAVRPDGNWTPSPRPEGETFSLTVDFGNGVEKRFKALPWSESLTVLEGLQAAAEFQPGVTFAYRDTGEDAFVTAIDGLSNAGAEGGNWIYEINGEKAMRSAGVQTLRPGDALLWRYSVPE